MGRVKLVYYAILSRAGCGRMEITMNKKNNALFFGENNDYTAVITLTDENGNEMDMEAVAAMEMHEMNKEYIAVVPTEPNDEFEEGEVMLLIYSEDKKGNPVFTNIDDPEEFEIVSEAFEQMVAEMAAEEDDDGEDITDDNYLDDISDIMPGVSIDYDK